MVMSYYQNYRKKPFEDANGKVCTKCQDYKSFLIDGLPQFGKDNKQRVCKECRNLAVVKRIRKKSPIKDDSFPLVENFRKARWVCKIHAETPENVYLNYRGHRVCKKCHFAAIVKANRDRRRRQNPEWKPWTDKRRREHTSKRKRTARKKARDTGGLL